jgi:hypothetical protein
VCSTSHNFCRERDIQPCVPSFPRGVLGLRSRPDHYVIAFIEKRQMSRVTCSVREVGEFVNIPKSTAYRALKSLTDKGFLVQFSRGTRSKTPGNRRAAIYGLGDPLNLRYGGRGGPSTKANAYKHRRRAGLTGVGVGPPPRGCASGVRALAPAPLPRGPYLMRHRSTTQECPMSLPVDIELAGYTV